MQKHEWLEICRGGIVLAWLALAAPTHAEPTHTHTAAEAREEGPSAPVYDGVITLDADVPQPATTPAPTQAQRPSVLEEIVVTARRREESIQDVPVAVTALAGDALRSAQITTAKDLVAQVPSLNVNTGNAREGNRFTIRGQGTTLGAGEGVSVYLAEAPMPQFGAGAAGLYYDLASLQVLNGPQGTLFGRNTTGGAVLFTPQRPSDVNEGYVQLGYGNYRNQEALAVANWAALPGLLSFRAAGELRQRDGYSHNLYDGRDYDDLDYGSYRLSALYSGAWLENYLLVSDTRSQPNGTALFLTDVNPMGPAVLLYPQLLLYQQEQEARGIRTTNFDSDSFFLARTFAIIDTATVRLGEAVTLKNIFSYFKNRSKNGFDVDGSPAATLVYYEIPEAGNPSAGGLASELYYSDELQLSGSALEGQLTWVTGGFYQTYEPDELTAQLFRVFGSLNRLEATESGSTKALYAQVTTDLGLLWPALADVSFTAGYRHTRDDKRATSNLYNPETQECIGQTGRFAPACTRRFAGAYSADTYTLGIDYQVLPTVLLYATHRTGYKAGGFNTASDPSQPYAAFGPEEVTDYEIGIKADYSLFGMPVRTNIAAFRDKYTDIQRNQTVSVTGSVPPRVTNVVLNAAAATIQGIEVLAALEPLPPMRLHANYSWLDARYDSFTLNNVDLSNEALPYSPRHKVGASVRYRLPVSPAVGELDLGLSYNYQSEFRATDTDQPQNQLGRYGLYNLDAGWTGVAGSPIDVELFVTNVTDKKYIQQSLPYYYSLGTSAVFYGEPRMYGLRVRYGFGD